MTIFQGHASLASSRKQRGTFTYIGYSSMYLWFKQVVSLGAIVRTKSLSLQMDLRQRIKNLFRGQTRQLKLYATPLVTLAIQPGKLC
jgi:hypothetical protein